MIKTIVPTKNLLIRPGNTFNYKSTYSENSILQNTTNYKGYMQFKQYKTSSRFIFQASSENGMIYFDGPNNSFTINIPSDKTTSMVPLFRRAFYDLLFIKPNGSNITVLQGGVILDLNAVTILP